MRFFVNCAIDWMRFEVDCAKWHHHVISEGLFLGGVFNMMVFIFARLFERLRDSLSKTYNEIAEWNGNEIILLNGLLILKVN